MGGRDVSRQWGVVVAVLAAIFLAGCASMREAEMKRLQARNTYERGLTNVRDRQVASALSAFQEAISLDETVAVYRNALGLLYLQELRRPDLALDEFRRAVEIEPTYADAQLNTGIALAELARWEEATGAYRKAIAIPTLAVPHIAYQNLGLALFHLKRYPEAKDALRFAISLEPQMAAAYYNLGLVLTAEGRREEAKAAFRRTRDLAPQSPFGQAAVLRLRALGEGG
jgi:superkiller protein 3